MKEIAKSIINSALALAGLKLYSVKAHGREDTQDIKRTGIDIVSIFDVGANVGQSVVKFGSAFPAAKVYSFEPVAAVYQLLSKNTASINNSHIFHMALGAEPGTADINIRRHQTTHTLAAVDDALATESVKVETVDRICQSEGIARIGILKIDVEGFDLEVLEGAKGMLQSGSVDFVLVECGFNPDDARHVLFDEVREFLSPFNYRLLGIYDQQLEWSGERRIRFANACFALQ